MRSLLTVTLAVLLMAVGAQAQMTLLTDFDGLTLGTAHGQDNSILALGRYQTQRNSSILGDPGSTTVESLVAAAPTNYMLQIQNRDLDGEIDTVYFNIWVGDMPITGLGTIYLRFTANNPNDTLLCTNDKYPGWDYDFLETGDAAAPNYQGTTNYAEQAVIVRMSGGEEFRARAGGVYSNVDMGQQVNAWQEMWIQVDHANDRTQYWLCPDGGTPTVVPNPAGGNWWGMRDALNNDSVQNLQWKIGMYPWPIPPEGGTETNVVIDSIAIDTAAMTTDRVAGWAPAPPLDSWVAPCAGADFDGDGDVDLDDFVILKSNFGTGTTQPQGDADCDGDVDLDDFVILKNTFGL